jgi:hypothetical protein
VLVVTEVQITAYALQAGWQRVLVVTEVQRTKFEELWRDILIDGYDFGIFDFDFILIDDNLVPLSLTENQPGTPLATSVPLSILAVKPVTTLFRGCGPLT